MSTEQRQKPPEEYPGGEKIRQQATLCIIYYYIKKCAPGLLCPDALRI